MISKEKYDILDESEFNSEIREGKFVDFSNYEKEFVKKNSLLHTRSLVLDNLLFLI